MIDVVRTEMFEFFKRSHMTQRSLARRLKVNWRTVYEWRRRYKGHPTITMYIEHENGEYYNVIGAVREDRIK